LLLRGERSNEPCWQECGALRWRAKVTRRRQPLNTLPVELLKASPRAMRTLARCCTRRRVESRPACRLGSCALDSDAEGVGELGGFAVEIPGAPQSVRAGDQHEKSPRPDTRSPRLSHARRARIGGSPQFRGRRYRLIKSRRHVAQSQPGIANQEHHRAGARPFVLDARSRRRIFAVSPAYVRRAGRGMRQWPH